MDKLHSSDFSRRNSKLILDLLFGEGIDNDFIALKGSAKNS